ncbi:MAG TPA: glycerate kinase, partial [Bacillota bacterium]|nr:glycerate kinase [Bacillota bacterium]
MKKIVVAPDSFKGTMSSLEVCDIIKNAIASIDSKIEVTAVPIADGGEGTVDALLSAAGGKKGQMDALEGVFG